jgi:hypothetical protein
MKMKMKPKSKKQQTIGVIGLSEQLFRAWVKDYGVPLYGGGYDFVKLGCVENMIGRSFCALHEGYDSAKVDPKVREYAKHRVKETDARNDARNDDLAQWGCAGFMAVMFFLLIYALLSALAN